MQNAGGTGWGVWMGMAKHSRRLGVENALTLCRYIAYVCEL